MLFLVVHNVCFCEIMCCCGLMHTSDEVLKDLRQELDDLGIA